MQKAFKKEKSGQNLAKRLVHKTGHAAVSRNFQKGYVNLMNDNLYI